MKHPQKRKEKKTRNKWTVHCEKKTTTVETDASVTVKEPRSIIVAHGVRNTLIKNLKRDIRYVFLPNTAQNVKEKKFNRTRDFLDVCGPLGVSHVMILFSRETGLNLKLIKPPQGPTVSFKVVSYSLISSVQRAQRKSFDMKTGLRSSPLVVMTNFQKSKHHELVVTMLRNMFPSVNPHTKEIKNKRRVVLFDYDAEQDLIRFRHYRISVPASGLNKGVKTLLYSKGVPDLGDVNKMSDFLSKSGYASESEGEEAAESRIHLTSELVSDTMPKGEPATRRVKLMEIGPRMDLMLHKIEQGVMEGLVLYNKLVEKSMEEIAETGRRREEATQLRAMRRKEQEIHVEKKRKERDEKREKAKNIIPRETVSDDDDANYYREQVGAEPDAHFGVRKRDGDAKASPRKKKARRLKS